MLGEGLFISRSSAMSTGTVERFEMKRKRRFSRNLLCFGAVHLGSGVGLTSDRCEERQERFGDEWLPQERGAASLECPFADFVHLLPVVMMIGTSDRSVSRQQESRD